MSERLKSLRRIKAVQKTLADLADWKLAAAERAKAEAVAQKDALDAFVAAERPTGALAGIAGRTAARLAEREHEAESRRADLAAGQRAAETRLKLVDRMLETTEAEERDKDERRRLDRLIEAMLAGAAAGDPAGR